ncbi:histidine phosphatase family protein [Vineibacter terrae]|nr:histidine phosphatase family protein [Vineibacter terrae]
MTAAVNGSAVTRWWWVRHAPVPNPEGRCYGQQDKDCDVSNDALFRHQASMLPRGAVWLTSGLLRAKRTAAALAACGADCGEPIAEARFNEQHFGDWQGRTYVELRSSNSHLFWLGPPAVRVPGGESFVDLFERTRDGILDHTARHRGRDIIAVTHGGTIRAAIAHAMTLDPEQAVRFEADNVSVTLIEHYEHADPAHAWRVVFTNVMPSEHRAHRALA